MGCGGSKLEEGADNASREIDNALEEDKYRDSNISKLLLLGAGEAGKSTLFKQVKCIYGRGFTKEERRSYIPVINQNIIESFKILCEESENLDEELDCRYSDDLEDSRAALEEVKDNMVTQELIPHIESLWEDSGIQKTYENRHRFQLPDCLPHFVKKLAKIAKPTYLPSRTDVIKSRVRTTGIVQFEFSIDGREFNVFDVGGQRAERKKWIHCFQDVTALIYVVAISGFDQTLFEDQKTNRLQESLTLFGSTCNSKWFINTSIILFLNKRDLFEDKLKHSNFADYFPDYDGENDPKDVSKYVISLFKEKNKNKNKKIYPHVTSATDANNVEHVFVAIKDIIVRKSMEASGLN